MHRSRVSYSSHFSPYPSFLYPCMLYLQ
uniref:Uncharacterized protein n=1 Tax=Anguilla anguilla TaxID=7936 RepID=A0A0E9TQ26_ANGAN